MTLSFDRSMTLVSGPPEMESVCRSASSGAARSTSAIHGSTASRARRKRVAFVPGDVVDDKFRIDGLLGKGGMGTVFAAHHLGLDKPVALKVLSTSGDASAIARFRREARAIARLESAAVARALDVGVTRQGFHYIVMDRLEGVDLGALLRIRGRMRADEAAALVLEVCQPLAEAHAAGIIHRDLKPQNLFLTEGRNGKKALKLLDFGLSSLGSSDEELTGPHQLLGTPHYMPPEQIGRPDLADPRSDVYSLGACLYALVAGEPPTTGTTLAQVLSSIRTASPPRLDERVDGVSSSFADLVARCLEKDARRRFASIEELERALRPHARGFGHSAESHVGDDDIVAMQEGVATAQERERFERHLADCAACRELVALSASSYAGVVPALPAPLPAQRRAPRWRWLGLVALGVVLAGAAASLHLGATPSATLRVSTHRRATFAFEAKPATSAPALQAEPPPSPAPQPLARVALPVRRSHETRAKSASTISPGIPNER